MHSPTLITGGAGFIGSTLTHLLIKQKHPAIVLDNFSTGQRRLLPRSRYLTTITADIRDQSTLTSTIKQYQPHTIIHLAAIHYIPYCLAHPQQVKAINIQGTNNLLTACRHFPPQTFLLASTAAVYRPSRRPHSETSPLGSTTIYGRSKLAAETACRVATANLSTRFLITRFFNAYGPNDTTPHLIPEILSQLKKGSTLTLGNTQSQRDYIFIDDLAAATLHLLSHTHGKLTTVNIGTSRTASAQDIVDHLTRLTHHPLTINPDPKKLRPTDRPHLQANITKLQKLYPHFSPLTLTQGLTQLIKHSKLGSSNRCSKACPPK